MQTVLTTNNGYDTVLLIDDDNLVVSAWMVDGADGDVIQSYLTDGAESEKWHVGQWGGFDGLAARIDDYGDEAGRNGLITHRKRAEYYADARKRAQATAHCNNPDAEVNVSSSDDFDHDG